MKRKNYIFILIIFGLFASSLKAQVSIENTHLFLFTDRDYCISGDTIWFKVFIRDGMNENGNVVHVQLDSPDNNLISTVYKRSEKGWAEGYMKIPDSLSTGVYFLTAFLNTQRSVGNLEIETCPLVVYNRFSGELTEISVPKMLVKYDSSTLSQGNNPTSIQNSNDEHVKNTDNIKINILPDKIKYCCREKVSVKIEFNDIDISKIPFVVVKATRTDEVASELKTKKFISYKSAVPAIPLIEEKDGFVLCGKVSDMDGEAQRDVLILLSIAGDNVYFDYCVSDQDGNFYFFLKNAEGVANAVLQAVTENQSELKIQILKNYLVRQNEVLSEQIILTREQSESISTLVNGNFFKRLFGEDISFRQSVFFMPSRFPIPFYGKPKQRIIPANFLELPNFKEISREILPGVQYRDRNGDVTFRVLNEDQGNYFENEPLRLINGVPVFKNNLFSSLNSAEIEYIETVFQKRLFGDLIFNGVLSVSLKNKSIAWLSAQPNLYQFDINCLQPDKRPDFHIREATGVNMPDIRQVYYWERMKTDTSKNISFLTSDLKGPVKITVEGVNEYNQPFKVSKRIEIE